MTSLSKSGRRGMDGGYPSPKTCRLVPPERGLQRLWMVKCLACPDPDVSVEFKPTREEAIEAHRAHVKAEHPMEER